MTKDELSKLSTEQLSLKLLDMIATHRARKVIKMSTFPIVGMFYHPPAKALVEVLPIGTPLTLIAEPDNAHDGNAVAVWLYSKDIPESSKEKLSELLLPYGLQIEDVLLEEMWHLGYVPREMAKQLREDDTVPVDNPVDGSFSLSSGGAPRVRLSNG